MRWTVPVAGMALVMVAGGAAAASVSAPTVRMEMVIVIPKGHRLAIFQQVVWQSQGGSGLVATLPGARNLRSIDAHLLYSGPSGALVNTPTGRFALRYSVPWNGHSSSLTLPTPASLGALLVLTPGSVVLPPVLNPLLQESGRGRIPGVPNSPVFREWGASAIHAGTPVMMVFEQAAPLAPARKTGTYPGAALAFQTGMALASLGALLVALNRRSDLVSRSGVWERLAEIRARYVRGVISADELQGEVRNVLALPEAGRGDG